MNNVPPTQQPNQPEKKPRILLKAIATFGAGLIAAVPLIHLAGYGAEKLVGIGKIQSTVEVQAKLIADLQVEKKSLSEKADQLQTKAHDLELKLNRSDSNLNAANQQLTQLTSLLGEYKNLNSQLGNRVRATDPCLAIQRVIADIEEKLAVSPPWSHALQGERREEAMTQLEKHQQSLRSCLSPGTKP
jgi:chromosome segregation ATPase